MLLERRNHLHYFSYLSKLLIPMHGAGTARHMIKVQWTHTPMFIGNTKASLKRTSWESNIPKPTVRSEFRRKLHIRAHHFEVAPHVTTKDLRNLSVYEIIRLICEMLKSENTFKQTEISNAVDTWTRYTASFRVRKTLWFIFFLL